MKHAVAKLSEYRSTYLHTQVRSWAALHGRHFFLREDGEVVPRETRDIMGEYLEYMHALRQALGNAVDSYGVIDLLKIPGVSNMNRTTISHFLEERGQCAPRRQTIKNFETILKKLNKWLPIEHVLSSFPKLG